MSRPRSLLTVALAGLLAAVMAVPAAADTNQFAGILDDGRLVRFTSQAPAALTTPLRPGGLVRGETLVALGGHQGRLYALGSSARLYAVDPVTARATAVAGGRELASGLRGRRFSLAISADGTRARIVSDVGQDVVVDLATGAETPGPGVRAADGSELRPAVATAPDGRLIGIDAARRLAVRETEPGAGVMATATLAFDRNRTFGPLTEPTGFAVAADGTSWALAALAIGRRDRQSQIVTVDPATGAARTPGDGVFLRRLVTIGALGRVATDRRAPRVGVRMPQRLSVRRLIARPLAGITVATGEAGQALVSFRIGTRRVGFGFATRDTPGTHSWQSYSFSAGDRRALRRAVGRRVRVIVTANDFNGNSRSVTLGTRLVR
jgi:hypothetical protein